MPDTTTRTDDQMALELAAKYEGLRTPCGFLGELIGVTDDGILEDCPHCNGRQWLPNLTTDAMLEVCREHDWQVSIKWIDKCIVIIMAAIVQVKRGVSGEGLDHKTAFINALYAATFGGA